ncbi:hypothetical protein TNCV_1338601 [Trichonephila clavipes]|nr:hypothetical protein TNCV_1338601 [Trichonephila clavipes]
MVSGEIFNDSRSTLMVISNTLTANLYVSLDADMTLWPARSSDLSPIKQVGDIIGGYFQQHPQPTLTVLV